MATVTVHALAHAGVQFLFIILFQECSTETHTDWTQTVGENHTFITEFSPTDWYIVCVYYVTCQVTTVG